MDSMMSRIYPEPSYNELFSLKMQQYQLYSSNLHCHRLQDTPGNSDFLTAVLMQDTSLHLDSQPFFPACQHHSQECSHTTCILHEGTCSTSTLCVYLAHNFTCSVFVSMAGKITHVLFIPWFIISFFNRGFSFFSVSIIHIFRY